MKIKRDKTIEAWLFDEIRTNIGKEAREHIHLSDLLTPRKAYWQRVKPMPITDEEIMYFTTGKGHEEFLLYVSGYDHGASAQWEGIYYTPDMFQTLPIEIKTRRRMLSDEGKEADTYDWYLRQLKGYCALSQRQNGWLWVWCLAQKQEDFRTKPEMHCLAVEFTHDELKEERSRLRFTNRQLLSALNSRNFTELPLCPDWMCVERKRVMERTPKCLTCNKDFSTDYHLKKHLESPKNKGCEGVYGVYSNKINPKCKWYEMCRVDL